MKSGYPKSRSSQLKQHRLQHEISLLFPMEHSLLVECQFMLFVKFLWSSLLPFMQILLSLSCAADPTASVSKAQFEQSFIADSSSILLKVANHRKFCVTAFEKCLTMRVVNDWKLIMELKRGGGDDICKYLNEKLSCHWSNTWLILKFQLKRLFPLFVPV